MNILATDFTALSQAEQIRHFEVEGFVILPALLDSAHILRIKQELADLPMRPSFYSPDPTFAATPPHWHSRSVAELIANPAMLKLMKALLGDQIVFTHGHFIRSHPGQPKLELHADYQPYGSPRVGWEESCPIRVRVMYYLDDTLLDRAPLRVVPRSHISFHSDANPYLRYEFHPDEVVVPMKAGDALAFAVRLFHGTEANTGNSTRELLELDYRPRWARPVEPMDEWDPALIDSAPAAAKPFVGSPNAFDRHWEDDANPTPRAPQPGETNFAAGVDPDRWESHI